MSERILSRGNVYHDHCYCYYLNLSVPLLSTGPINQYKQISISCTNTPIKNGLLTVYQLRRFLKQASRQSYSPITVDVMHVTITYIMYCLKKPTSFSTHFFRFIWKFRLYLVSMLTGYRRFKVRTFNFVNFLWRS